MISISGVSAMKIPTFLGFLVQNYVLSGNYLTNNKNYVIIYIKKRKEKKI